MSEIQLRVLNADDQVLSEVQAVLAKAPTYTYRIFGRAPRAEDAQENLSALPPGKEQNDKFFYGIFRDGKMIGCADVVRGFPTADTAYIGLLLIAEDQQGLGLGQESYEMIEEKIREWKSQRIRLAVVRTNGSVLPFWRKQGFLETGEVKPYRHELVESESILLEKRI